MHIESATTVKNHFGAIMDAALREPVVIQRSGRNSVVMIPYDSYKDYEAFEALSDKIWAEKAMEAEREGYLGTDESENIIQKFLNADT